MSEILQLKSTSSLAQDYTYERLNSLILLLQKPGKEFTENDFHKIRVDIKKINAIGRLLHFSDKNFKRKKFIKKYRQLFFVAGNIREIQIEVQLLKEMKLEEELGEYIRQRSKQLKKYTAVFSVLEVELEKYAKKSGKKLMPLIGRIDAEIAQDYINYLETQLYFLFEATHSHDEDVHELRKKLKEFMYAVNVFGCGKYNIKAVDKLQDLLGKWHDNLVMSNHLFEQKEKRNSETKVSARLGLVASNLRTLTRDLFGKIIKDVDKYRNGRELLPAMNRSSHSQ